MAERKVGPKADLPPGSVKRTGPWAVGNADGSYFAVSRLCRHQLGDLSKGSIDREGCIVCPRHGARYDTSTGRMVRGPQGIYAKIPGLGAAFKALTAVLPLRRAKVEERGDDLWVG